MRESDCPVKPRLHADLNFACLPFAAQHGVDLGRDPSGQLLEVTSAGEHLEHRPREALGGQAGVELRLGRSRLLKGERPWGERLCGERLDEEQLGGTARRFRPSFGLVQPAWLVGLGRQEGERGSHGARTFVGGVAFNI